MKIMLPLACILPVLLTAHPVAAKTDRARWQEQAARVTIQRDDWGIAHVHGRSDADAVFGMIYAQAEDDFNRIELNFLNSQGRLAEAEGEVEHVEGFFEVGCLQAGDFAGHFGLRLRGDCAWVRGEKIWILSR